MRGRLQSWGRCRLEGHGQSCELSQIIREGGVERAAETRAWRREIADQVAQDSPEAVRLMRAGDLDGLARLASRNVDERAAAAVARLRARER